MLSEELHKPVIKKFRRKVYARFKDNILIADLAEMGSLILLLRIEVLKYLLYVIDAFTKHAWVKMCHRCFHQICLS